MNKIRTAVAALLIAGGAIVAFAFTKADTETSRINKASELHWFDASTGDYLGERTQEMEQQACGNPGNIDCAYGFELDQNGDPIPSTQVTVKKQ